MKSTIQCIVLLACIAICSSAAIKNCQCVKTNKAVDGSQILAVKELKPRPYCNKHEVIVTMKNNSSRCLDPESEFTKRVLEAMQVTRARMRTTILKTTTTTTTTSAATRSPAAMTS